MLVELSSYALLPFLFVTGLVAGTVDAIAGGGGLITVPTLLGIGLPPQLALGTNKLQSAVGTAMAAHSYHRQGWVDAKAIKTGLLCTCIGAIAGAVTIQFLSSDLLKQIIPLCLMVILAYMLFSPRLGREEREPKVSERVFFIIFGTLLGFYDGFLGPGVGSFWVFLLIYFLGKNLVKATAYTKLFNANTNVTALICFVIGGNVDYRIGLCMAAGQLLGGRLGAHFAIRKGARLIRPLFLLVVTATMSLLIYKNYIYTGELARCIHQIGIPCAALFATVSLVLMAFGYRFIGKRQNNQS